MLSNTKSGDMQRPGDDQWPENSGLSRESLYRPGRAQPEFDTILKATALDEVEPAA